MRHLELLTNLAHQEISIGTKQSSEMSESKTNCFKECYRTKCCKVYIIV